MSIVDDGEGHLPEALAAYLAGALTSEQDLVVEAHLARCVHCLAESHRIGQVADRFGLLTDADVDSVAG
jgi:anti-sigma factor RsiW